MIAIILLVCILFALAATAYFPGNEGGTYRPPRSRLQGPHRRADRVRNPNKLDTALRNRRWEVFARDYMTRATPETDTTSLPPPLSSGR